MERLIETAQQVSASLSDVLDFDTLLVEFDLVASREHFAALERVLSPLEVSRADRFVTEQLRERFVVCRGVLRTLLGAIDNRSPEKITFQDGRWGKPSIIATSVLPVEFNVSNSDDKAVVAFSKYPVGVDLECLRDGFRHRSIASQVLSSSEQAAWDKIPARERDQQMMRLWVCKEALLKGMGLGIAEGLLQTSFPLPIPCEDVFCPERIGAELQIHLDDDGTCRTNHFTDASAWRMQIVEPGPRYFLSLASSLPRANMKQADTPRGSVRRFQLGSVLA